MGRRKSCGYCLMKCRGTGEMLIFLFHALDRFSPCSFLFQVKGLFVSRCLDKERTISSSGTRSPGALRRGQGRGGSARSCCPVNRVALNHHVAHCCFCFSKWKLIDHSRLFVPFYFHLLSGLAVLSSGGKETALSSLTHLG